MPVGRIVSDLVLHPCPSKRSAALRYPFEVGELRRSFTAKLLFHKAAVTPTLLGREHRRSLARPRKRDRSSGEPTRPAWRLRRLAATNSFRCNWRHSEKVRDGRAPSPTRGARVFPRMNGFCRFEQDRRCALLDLSIGKGKRTEKRRWWERRDFETAL